MKKIILLALFILATSCSLAPFSSNTSGRSYGAGKAQFEFGSANSSYFMKMGYGLSQNLDLGYVMEFGALSTSGIFTKYSFLNNETGPSLAMELGYGGTDTTTYYYAGLIGSLAFTKYIELFVNPRFNKVSTDEKDVDLGKTYGNIKVNNTELDYLYLAYGINIWFNDVAGISIYSIYVKGDNIESEENQSTAATLLFKI